MSAFSQKSKSPSSSPSAFSSRRGEDFFGVQAKLNIGKSNDKYEVEADKAADTVVSNKKNTSAEPLVSTSVAVQPKLKVVHSKQTKTPDTFFTPSPLQSKKKNEVQKKENPEKEIQKESETKQKSVVQLKTEKEEKVQKKTDSLKPKEKVIAPQSVIQPKKEEEIQAKEEEEIQTKEDEKELQLSASVDANPSDTSNLESTLNSTKGGGAPLSGKVKTEMESGFGTDFSNVRIHNNTTAVQMNQQLGSQAFATGNNIYFNEGKYNPNSRDGRHLLAHELTHTIQQGASIRKKAEPVTPAPEMIQGSFLDLVPDWIINRARHVPGYTLFTVIIGYDPLRQVNVERTPINLVEGLMGLIPFGTAIFDKLQEYGILQKVFDWVQGKLSELGLTVDSILDMVEDVWNAVSFPYTDIIDLIVEKFNEVVNRITSFVSATVDQVITWIKEALIDVAEPILAENKAWSLIKKIIKYDPLRNQEVSATTVEILEDFLILIGKETELEQMREKGTLQKTADWLDTQVGTFNSLLGELRSLITAAWDAIQPSNLANIADNLLALATQAGAFLQRVWDFASGVALKVLELVKDSLLGWVSAQASSVRGYSLVKVIIGRDPFTGETVARTVPNLIKGFMSLMEGGEQQYAQMVETGAIARIAGQVEAAVAALNMTPASIIQLFTDLWNSFTINDLINPIDAFTRIIEKFGEPIGRLIAFVAEIIRIVIMAILEIMNFPFDLIGNIISRAMQAIDDIKKDPIGFLKNILRAIKQGFVQFFSNIVNHLINGVTGWLMSELKDANLPVLTDFSLKGVISWVLEVLGISMEKIWEKLAAHPRIGPARVAKIRGMINTLEGIWTFIKDVQERGMAAIWDKIQEQLSNLWNTLLDSVKNFVMERIVNRITAKLLSMLDPTGIMAVINGAMALYNAIESFVKYLRQMLEVVNSFVNGVADIAKGNVTTAANYLERTMGEAMPIVIGFLANQVGLTGIGAKIGEMIISVQKMVDEALTWLVNKAVDTGMAMLDKLMAMGASARDAILGFLGIRREFTLINGEHHEIYFKGNESAPIIIVASANPKTIDNLISERESLNKPPLTNDQKKKLNDAKTKKTNLLEHIQKDKEKNKGGDIDKALQSYISAQLDLIKQDLKDGDAIPVTDTNLPLTNVSYGMEGSKAKTIIAEPLTRLGGNTQGQELTSGTSGPEITGDKLANAANSLTIDGETTSSGRAKRASVDWRRIHLVSHRMFGPLEPWNLSWNKTKANSDFFTHEISTAKAINDLSKSTIFSYQVTVNYNSNVPLYNGEGDVVGNLSDYASSFSLVIKKKEKNEDPFQPVASPTIPGTTQAPALNVAEVITHLTEKLRKKILAKTEKLHAEGKTNSWGMAASNPFSRELRKLTALAGAGVVDQIRKEQEQKRAQLSN